MCMSGLAVKKKLADIFEFTKVNDTVFTALNRKHRSSYIRIINYHDTSAENIDNFEKHLAWYQKEFEDCSLEKFEKFLNSEYVFTDRPGLIITFDDGFTGNYLNAYPILKKYGFTGYFFVSAAFVGTRNYMDVNQLTDLLQGDQVVGCHTYTHHRMDPNDSDEILIREILTSKIDLERILRHTVDIFCWVGGEESTYTKRAAGYIKKAGYKYSMMTNSQPVLPDTDRFRLNRTNISDDWKLSLVKFQLSGIMDLLYAPKRRRVNQLTGGGFYEKNN